MQASVQQKKISIVVCQDQNSNENLTLISCLIPTWGEAWWKLCPGYCKAEDGADPRQRSSVHTATGTAPSICWHRLQCHQACCWHTAFTWGEAETSPLHRRDHRVILLNCTTIKIFLSISGGWLVSKMSDGFFYKLNFERCLFLTKNKLSWASGRWHSC